MLEKNFIKKLFKHLLLCVLLVLTSAQLFAQSVADRVVKDDYPKLMALYENQGHKLSDQRAHYIFAIDVSSFMRTNLAIIKPMIEEFINALPDGDQVTFIRKSSTDNTDYVGGIRSMSVNASTRNTLIRTLHSDAFSIQDAGSDGFAMTNKILDAIVNPMSEGLVFVFMFTDFEYWTHENGYDKQRENWQVLHDKLAPFLNSAQGDQSRVIFPYAVYFKDNEYREVADYRPELVNIFGSLNQPPSGDANVLRTFFHSMEANALVFRLKYLIYHDLLSMEMQSNLFMTDDDSICTIVQDTSSVIAPMCTKYTFNITEAPDCLDRIFTPIRAEKYDFGSSALIYTKNSRFNPILPYFTNLGGVLQYEIIPLCDEYENELNMLNALDNSVALDYHRAFSFQKTLPEKTYFLHCLPAWLDILILLIAFTWLLCLFVTFLMNKFGNIYRTWNIVVTRTEMDESETKALKFPKAKKIALDPKIFGFSDGSWGVDIIVNDSAIYKFWKPRGYYLKRKGSTIVNLQFRGREKALPISEYYLCALKKLGRGFVLNINEGSVQYKINVR